MIPPIVIGFEEIFNGYNLSEESVGNMVDNVLSGLGRAFVNEWESHAGNTLGSTRREYINSIRVNDVRRGRITIELVGFLPNAVEQGLSAFDMKRGFSKSAKRRSKKDGGWYLTIPFRIGVPGTIGDAVGFSDIMTDTMYSLASSVKPGTTVPKSLMSPGDLERGSRPPVINESREFKEYKHKNSVFEGMVRGSGKNHGQYHTFRRVSDKSDSLSWIHTGIKARNLADKALTSMDIPGTVAVLVDKHLGLL